MDASLLLQKDHEKEVLDLNDEMVVTASVYFEQAMKSNLFLYPTLDLSSMDPFNGLSCVGVFPHS